MRLSRFDPGLTLHEFQAHTPGQFAGADAGGVMRNGIAVGFGVCLLFVSAMSCADQSTGLDPYEEFGKHLQAAQAVAPVGDSVFGDEVSLYNGATTFEVTDFSIPGNSALPVSLGRRLIIDDRRVDPGYLGGFGDWDLDIPYIEAVVTTDNGWKLNSGSTARCSDTTDTLDTEVPGPVGNIPAPLNVVWNGDQLHIPGMSDQELLVNNQSKSPANASAGTYKWVTKGNWKVSCLPSTANGYPGEAFQAVSPSGVTYTFNWVVVKAAPSVLVETVKIGSTTSSYYADRQRVFMLVTQVEDRFGNTVTYSYNGSQLTSITSNTSTGNPRSISLTWSGNNIASANSALGTWQYGYGADSGGRTVLTSVTRPDQSAWTYIITSGALETTKPVEGPQNPPPPPNHCQLTPWANQGTFDYQVVAPSGAVGTFDFEYRRNYRVGVPLSCPDSNPYPLVYTFFDNFALVQKSIDGPGLPSMLWKYTYAGSTLNDVSGSAPGYVNETIPYDSSTLVYLPGGSCANTSPGYNVTVVGPTSTTQYAFGKTYGCDDGRLYGTEVEDTNGNVLKSTTNTYVDETAAPNEPFATVAGEDQLANFVNPTANRNRPVTQTVVTQDGVTFTTTVNSFDTFVRATSETETGTASRTVTTAYYDDLSNWVLGQISSTSMLATAVPCNTSTATDADLTSCTIYYPDTDLLKQTYQFGRLVASATWYGDGTLASVKDGNNQTTSYPSWKRGLPTEVDFADGTSEFATISDAGWITALKDENGFTTDYGYDPMGRLSVIDYPTGDSVNWNATSISFTPTGAGQYGTADDAWVQSIKTGNDVTNTYFDALWRPLVTEHYDNGNVNGTMSQVVDGYDAGGRKVFQSYPTRSATSYTQSLPGIHTSYDALDRLTEVDQDSDIGSLPTTTQYLSGFRTEVTSPNEQGTGVSTITSYLAYGEPTTQWPISITAPEGELTDIDRDAFGKPLTITRTGTASGSPSLTQTFTYNGYQQLCGHTDPESGTTAYGYDGAGNLAWSASGLDASTGCYSEDDASATGRMVTRTYYPRNWLKTITYPDGFSNASFGYYADGKLESQSVANGGFPVSTMYTYNKRRLLTSETESLPGTSAFAIGYGYDANGHLASVVYPDGRTITYLPNALGQPTQVGTYATNAQYFPNGTIQSYTYGSGAVYTATEDKRGLVGHSVDSQNGTAAMDFTYNYDGDGNVAAITDGISSAGDVDMTYDLLDRLKEADSQRFGPPGSDAAIYKYDDFDNLTSAALGNQSSFNYAYNAKNQLAALTDPSTGNDEVEYQYDVQGNLASKNAQTYQFDMANRLEGASGLANYRYDAAGRRAQKVELTTGKTLDSDYSEAGLLMYQWDPATLNATDYIYLGDTLVSRVVGNNSQVIGNIDGAPTADNPAVGGWACSTGITDSINVELYVGGPWNGDDGDQGTLVATATADLPSEPGVASACGTNGTNYRFSIPISAAVESQYPNEPIWVYGDSPVGNGTIALTNSGTYTVPANPSAPEPPASISVPSTNTGGTYTVSWSTSSGATSYVLQQESNIMPSWEQVYSGASTSTSVSVGSLEFRYQVQACNASGCSAFSSPSSWVTVVPAASASISVPSSSYSPLISVSWVASSIATNYVLEERENGGGWGVAWNGDATSTTVTVSSTGTYQFQIAACGEAGCSAFTASNNVAVTLPPTSAPTLSGPSSSTTGSYTLSWNTVAGATRYQLNQNLSGTVTTPYNANGTSWSSSNLGNGTHNYQVFGCNVAGCGPGSNGLAVSVLHVPAVPASVSAPANATLSVPFTVSWSGVSGATSYTLQQTDTNNGNVATKYTGSGTSASVDEGLPGYYTFEVKACNASGCSGWRGAPGMTDVERSGGPQTIPASGGSL